MGLEDILRKILKRAHKEDISGKEKEIEGAHELEKDYLNLSNKYGLDYDVSRAGYFLVLANKRLSEDADHRKKDTPPWPGIKIHSPLSEKMYKVLKSDDFKKMLKDGEIDGIKVYLYNDPYIKHKEVTIYMSLYSIPYYKKFIDILEKKGISVQPVIPSYNDMVYLNRMHIAPNAGIFARYSTDFTGKMNINDIKDIINDYIIDKYWSKIDDHVWRVAADDESIPRIVAVSRSWLLNNQYNLDYILRNSYASLKDFYYKLWETKDPKELLRYFPTIPTIYTFIKLGEIDGTIVAYPNIIIDKNNNILEAYDIFRAKIVKYDLSNIEDISRISRNPKDDLYEFLKYGTISQ